MMPTKTLLICALSGLFLTQVRAATVVQCEDENGNKSYQAYCPPGSKEVGQKTYSVDEYEAPEGPQEPLILYVTPNCDTCNQVKEFLAFRKLPVEERDVDNNAALQQELKEKSGELRVPVLMVGDTALAGFNRDALLSALAGAGYTAGAEAPAAAAEAEQ